MSAHSAFPFAVLAVGLGIALHNLRDADSGDRAVPQAATSSDARSQAVVPVALRRSAELQGLHIEARFVDGRLVRTDNLEAAGTRRHCSVTPSVEGIEFPDGTKLPLLNGLSEAPPVASRNDAGQLAPVVAIVVDADGWEWYEHADGARTTSRLQAVHANGVVAGVRAVSLHEAAGASGRPVEGAFRKGRANLGR